VRGIWAAVLLGAFCFASHVPAAAAEPPGDSTPLVVVGAVGISWTESLPDTTAVLRERGAWLANMSTRTRQEHPCGVDTWQLLRPITGAATQSGDPKPEGAAIQTPSQAAAEDTIEGPTQIPSQTTMQAQTEGPAQTAGPEGVLAVGAGAWIAADGLASAPVKAQMPASAEELANLVDDNLNSGASLVVVDAGSEPDTPLELIDQRIAAVAAAGSARVMVVTVCHPPPRQFGMSAYIDPAQAGAQSNPDGWSLLSSPTTRHRGLITVGDLADLAAGKLGATGKVSVSPAPPGAPWADLLVDDANHAWSAAYMMGPSYIALIASSLLAFLPAAAFALTKRRRWPVAWARACLFIAATAPAVFLVNLFPWWRAGPPGSLPVLLTFAAISYTLAAIITVAATLLLRRWRPIGPPAGVAAVVVGVIVLDATSSSFLGWGAPFGPNPIHGGRFFGIPNVEFAFLTAAALVLTALVLGAWFKRWNRWAWLATGVMGCGLTVIDSAPQFGADLGGSPVILPAFALFGFIASGRRLGVKPLLASAALGVVAFAAVTFFDWLRGPDQWTHAGAFGQDLVQGGVMDVIVRKGLNSVFLTVLFAPLVGGLVLVGVWTWRRIKGTADMAAYRKAVPLAGACLAGQIPLAVLGALLNDAGMAGIAMGLGLGLLLLLAAAPPPASLTGPGGVLGGDFDAAGTDSEQDIPVLGSPVQLGP
jgi:hypothetical protein